MTRIVPYVNLPLQWEKEKSFLLPVIEAVLAGGKYILDDTVERLERRVSALCGVQYGVGLNSGTDALILGLSGLGIKKGDEVITPPNSFIASAAAVAHLGATPVFVDVLPNQLINPEKVRSSISPKTRAIMPVHLSGNICNLEELLSISRETGIPIIEDAAQAIGSTFDGKRSGSFGEVGCFSAHPLKTLGAAGDAGFLVTDNEEVALRAREWRNHGQEDRTTVTSWGGVSRLDSLQAAILLARIERLEASVDQRRENASVYKSELSDLPILLPQEETKVRSAYHTFVIQTPQRDKLQQFLASSGIGTSVHYPKPIHLQPAASYLGYKFGDFPVCETQADRILSLPIHQYLTRADLDYVVSSIRHFFVR